MESSADLFKVLCVIFLLSAFRLPADAASTLQLPTACDRDVLSQCHGFPMNKKVCYDGHVYPNMCAYMLAACDGQVRPNVSVPTTDPSCDLVIVVILTSPATTVSPTLNNFQNALFTNAIHGIDDLLIRANHSGATLKDQITIFSTQNHTSKTYVRNTKCWAYPLDLTMISPWNSNLHERKAGVLVTPRHALWARHYSMPTGTTLRFVDHDNNVIDRRIVRTQGVPFNGTNSLQGADIVIGELDSDLPNSISYARVFPRNLDVIRPLRNMSVPVFGTDFEEKALVANLNIESGNMVNLALPEGNSLRYMFYESKITGDSGNPVFMVVDNEPVLMFMLTYGGAGSGTSITYHFDALNGILHQWGSEHRLKEKDLTHFLDVDSFLPSIIG